VSFTKKGLNIRLPADTAEADIQEKLSWAKSWAHKKLMNKPALLIRYEQISYHDGSVIPIYNNHWTLRLQPSSKSRLRFGLEANELVIQVPRHRVLSSKEIKQVITKEIVKQFSDELEERTRQINHKSIQADFDQVQLKYLSGRWGSCHVDGIIQYSTRLVLLPTNIQNMIIFHELCHLVHFDHSAAFYALLHQYMPDYSERDAWLRQYEHVYDY